MLCHWKIQNPSRCLTRRNLNSQFGWSDCCTIYTRIIWKAKVWSIMLTHSSTNSRRPNSGFYEDDDDLLRHQHPLIPVLQQIVIAHSLWDRLCTIVHYHDYTNYPDVTECMLPYCTSFIYHRWPPMSPLFSKIVCIVENIKLAWVTGLAFWE